jgi:hypothetical protein
MRDERWTSRGQKDKDQLERVNEVTIECAQSAEDRPDTMATD